MLNVTIYTIHGSYGVCCSTCNIGRLTSVSVLLSSWCSALKVTTYGLFLSPCCWNHDFSIFASWRRCDFLWLLLQVSNCDKIWRPTQYPYCLPHCVWVEPSFLSLFFTEKKMLETPSLYLLLKTAVHHGLPHSFPLKLPLLTGILTKVSCQVPIFSDKYPMIFPFTGKLDNVWLYVLYIPIHWSHSQNPHIHVDYSAVNEHSYGNDHL